jgi:vacuolar-type H+-ATPase subunit D/Vma8
VSALSQLLERLRRIQLPPGAAAGAVAVPSAVKELSGEVTFLFEQLDQIAQQGNVIVASARAEASQLEAAAADERRRPRACGSGPRPEAADARAAWQDASTQAALWSDRAAVLDGAGRLDLLARHAHQQASLELSWSNLMGARIPAIEAAAVPDPPPVSALGGSSAAAIGASRSCEAVRAAARYAVAQRAERELSAELTPAARRLRALRDRWIPQHEAALARLDLDESEREQAARVRWLTRRRVPASGSDR